MDYRAAAAGPTLLHPLVHRLPSIYKITANNCLLSVHNRYLVKPIVVLFVTVACKYCQIYETYFSYLYNRTDKITVFHYDHFALLDGVFSPWTLFIAWRCFSLRPLFIAWRCFSLRPLFIAWRCFSLRPLFIAWRCFSLRPLFIARRCFSQFIVMLISP